MVKDVDSKLSRLLQQKAGLESRIRREKHMLSTQARKHDAHRKIVVGAAVLAACRDDADLRRLIAGVLDARISHARDRDMLGLPPVLAGETAF